MPDRDVLKGLLEGVRAAAGPDRKLDVAIWRTFIDLDARPDRAPLPWDYRFTASIDAAIALMERVLPGWDIHFYPEGEGRLGYVAEMTWPPNALVGEANYFGIDGRGLTRPLAIVAAVLEAKLTLSRQAALIAAEDRTHG